MRDLAFALGLALLALHPAAGWQAATAGEAALQELRFGSIGGGALGS